MQKILLIVGVTLGSVSAIAPGAIASELTTSRSMTDLSLPELAAPLPPRPAASSQSVSQSVPIGNFPDVSPNHWAYPAVDALVVDYACLAGYPDGTFRGEDLVTRYEFAAALEACLDSLVQVADQPQPATVDQILNDLEALNRELGTLSGEIEAVESDILAD